MDTLLSGMLPGISKIGGELYLKNNHPGVYGRILVHELWERYNDFTADIQYCLSCYRQMLQTLNEYRDDMRQSGMQEFLALMRRDILRSATVDTQTQQDIIARLYSITMLLDELERIYAAMLQSDSADLLFDVLRRPDDDSRHENPQTSPD